MVSRELAWKKLHIWCQKCCGIFHRTKINFFLNSYRNTKDPEQPKQSRKERRELEESCSLTLDYTSRLQYSEHYGTGTKTDTVQWNKTKNPEIQPYLHRQLIYNKGKNTLNKTQSLQ